MGCPERGGRTVSLQRQLEAALRDLERFDRVDKGSKWLTHPEEGKRLGAKVRALDVLVEAALGTEVLDRVHKRL